MLVDFVIMTQGTTYKQASFLSFFHHPFSLTPLHRHLYVNSINWEMVIEIDEPQAFSTQLLLLDTKREMYEKWFKII